VIRWVAWAIVGLLKPKALLVAENMCLRQQLVVLLRRQPRPRLGGADRHFWILAKQWYSGWRDVLLIVQPETVLRWHREGRRAYWRWRSRRRGRGGRRPISAELRALIRRMASENRYWGQRRIQAELARLGFKVSARTVAKYMRRPSTGRPSPSWREFLKRHARDIWACDFFCVQTIWFQTFYVFFAIRHANREVVHAQVTRHPTAEWVAQQIVECCGWDREPPRFLIHDRDSRYGKVFDRRLNNLGITQIRTPTAGGLTDPLGNARRVRRRGLSKATSAATSLRSRFWVGSITSTIWPHDHSDRVLRPTGLHHIYNLAA
jgi:hypothetical protein